MYDDKYNKRRKRGSFKKCIAMSTCLLTGIFLGTFLCRLGTETTQSPSSIVKESLIAAKNIHEMKAHRATTSLLKTKIKKTPRKQIILSAGKNGTWMYNMNRRVILCSTESIECHKKDRHGRDGQSLVHFVLYFWDELENIRFGLVHGGLVEWHQPNPFIPALEKAFASSKPFVHLGLKKNYKTIDFQNTGWCKNAWRPYVGPCPKKVCVAQGLEFVANGELFKWLPKEKWELLGKIGYGELAVDEFHLPNDPWLGIDYMFEWMIFPLANLQACPSIDEFW